MGGFRSFLVLTIVLKLTVFLTTDDSINSQFKTPLETIYYVSVLTDNPMQRRVQRASQKHIAVLEIEAFGFGNGHSN